MVEAPLSETDVDSAHTVFKVVDPLASAVVIVAFNSQIDSVFNDSDVAESTKLAEEVESMIMLL